MWEAYKKGFKAYLQLEKSLANNSVEAYLTDIDKVTTYFKRFRKICAMDCRVRNDGNLPSKNYKWVA